MEDGESIFIENEKLVGYVYNKFFRQKYHEYEDDLIQEGRIALWKCINKYDNDKNCFSTFAVKCIKNSLYMFLRRELACGKRCVSLYEQISNTEGLVIEDVVEDNGVGVEEKTCRSDSFKEILKKKNEIKGEKKRSIIEGWISGKNCAELGREFGVTKSYCSLVVNEFKKKCSADKKLRNMVLA